MNQGVRRPARVAVTESTSLPLFAAAAKTPVWVPKVGQASTISTGLTTLDQAMDGGFPAGGATLVAGRPRVGVTSLMVGAALSALKRGDRVAFFSSRLREEQMRGRFVVLESKVNGHRVKAGFVSAEDRISLAAARERIAWSKLTLLCGRALPLAEVEAHLAAYRPQLALFDVQSQCSCVGGRADKIIEWSQTLQSLAAGFGVAAVVRALLPKGENPPHLDELSGGGALGEVFSSTILFHREEVTDPNGVPEKWVGRAEAQIVRIHGRPVPPRIVELKFDPRFAGLSDL